MTEYVAFYPSEHDLDLDKWTAKPLSECGPGKYRVIIRREIKDDLLAVLLS